MLCATIRRAPPPRRVDPPRHGPPCSELLERPAALGRARHPRDLMPRLDELPDERPPDRTRGARDEDPHRRTPPRVRDNIAARTTAPIVMYTKAPMPRLSGSVSPMSTRWFTACSPYCRAAKASTGKRQLGR